MGDTRNESKQSRSSAIDDADGAGRSLGLCCHPYDLCTELLAREAGVIVGSPGGQPLCAPLDRFTDVSWVRYANEAIAAQVGPVLAEALHDHGIELADELPDRWRSSARAT